MTLYLLLYYSKFCVWVGRGGGWCWDSVLIYYFWTSTYIIFFKSVSLYICTYTQKKTETHPPLTGFWSTPFPMRFIFTPHMIYVWHLDLPPQSEVFVDTILHLFTPFLPVKFRALKIRGPPPPELKKSVSHRQLSMRPLSPTWVFQLALSPNPSSPLQF